MIEIITNKLFSKPGASYFIKIYNKGIWEHFCVANMACKKTLPRRACDADILKTSTQFFCRTKNCICYIDDLQCTAYACNKTPHSILWCWTTFEVYLLSDVEEIQELASAIYKKFLARLNSI